MFLLRKVQRITLCCHVVFFAAIGGCRRDDYIEMKDTEGRAFNVTCKEAKGCSVAPRTTASATSVAALTLRSDGRVLGVCDRDGPPISCRPLLCEADTDCPTVDGIVRTCERSLCSEPSRPLSRTDVVMLCMAETGVGYEQAVQREQYGTALAWEPSTPLPAGCRKP